MKTKEDVKFATVGKLLKELKKIKAFDEECMYYCPTVFVNNIDELYLGIVGMGPDEDGDLCIELEEMDTSEGFFDVTDCILKLEEFDKKTKVYLAGIGLYLNFDQDGSIFCEPDEDDETVGCYANIFGNYTPEPKPESEEDEGDDDEDEGDDDEDEGDDDEDEGDDDDDEGDDDEDEGDDDYDEDMGDDDDDEDVEEQPKIIYKTKLGNGNEQRGETIVLVALTLSLICGLIYNVYALIAGVDGPLWERIIWIIVCAILTVLNISVLIRSRN